MGQASQLETPERAVLTFPAERCIDVRPRSGTTRALYPLCIEAAHLSGWHKREQLPENPKDNGTGRFSTPSKGRPQLGTRKLANAFLHILTMNRVHAWSDISSRLATALGLHQICSV